MENREEKDKNIFFHIIAFIKLIISKSMPFIHIINFLKNLKIANEISPIDNYSLIKIKNQIILLITLAPLIFLFYRIYKIYIVFNEKVAPNLVGVEWNFSNIIILIKVFYPYFLAVLIVSSIIIVINLVLNFIVLNFHIKIKENKTVLNLLLKNELINKKEIKDFFIFRSHEGIYLGHENYSQEDIMHWRKFWEKLNFKIGNVTLGRKNTNLSFYEKKYNLKRQINYEFHD